MKTNLFNKVYATYATTVNVKLVGKTEKLMGCKEADIMVDQPVEFHKFTGLMDGKFQINSYIGFGKTRSGDWALIQNGFNEKIAKVLFESEDELMEKYAAQINFYETAKTINYTKEF